MESRQGKQSVEEWLCPECGEEFRTKVTHCLHCDHHYPPEDGECSNCHNSLRGAPKALRSDSDRSQRRDKAAKATGRGVDTLSKAKQVVDYGDKDLVDMMDKTGNVNKAYRYVKQKKDEKKIIQQ